MGQNNFRKWLDRLDLAIVRWLARYSLPFLRIGMGIVLAIHLFVLAGVALGMVALALRVGPHPAQIGPFTM